MHSAFAPFFAVCISILHEKRSTWRVASRVIFYDSAVASTLIAAQILPLTSATSLLLNKNISLCNLLDGYSLHAPLDPMQDFNSGGGGGGGGMPYSGNLLDTLRYMLAGTKVPVWYNETKNLQYTEQISNSQNLFRNSARLAPKAS